MTQTLIIHVIRTNKSPLLQSRASWALTLTTLVIMAFAVWLPYSPMASALGFTHLPRLYWPFLLATLLGYVGLTQITKMGCHASNGSRAAFPTATATRTRGYFMISGSPPVKRPSRIPVANPERHRTGRIGWLRAAVLGANDGILSTSSLVLGVAAAHGTHSNLMIAGSAGLVAGAMSMAAGEYVSVHSQADTEQAELELERAELKADTQGEHRELTAIYVARGLDPSLAKQVAEQLMAHDALGAHARDELGISEALRARPMQASLASAASFAVGAAMPLLITAAAPMARLIPLVSVSSLVLLALLGGLAARAGGAGVTLGAIRVTFWGALAMAVTAGVGALFGTVG
jgi:VIT1/CCC1 family predicted Fe2+/Mn2+ transporter